MAYDAKTERLISIKKLSGKAQTSNDKGLANEALPSGITMASSTVLGQVISSDPSNTSTYTITGKVEYLRFPSSFIAGSDTSDGRHGFELKLPSDYESNSSNSKAGTYPFQNDQVINITSGSLQLVSPSFSTTYEVKPFYGGTSAKDSGTQIPVLDARDWYMDYFNGVFFQQDPSGTGDQSDNPDFVEGFLYIGDMLNTVVSNAGGGGGGGSSFFSSPTNGVLNTTGSTAFAGALGTSYVPSSIGADAFFFVSGSTSSKSTSVRGTSVFGGDIVVSGTLYADSAIISGSLTRLASGESYLISSTNISIVTSSLGSITISSSAQSQSKKYVYFLTSSHGESVPLDIPTVNFKSLQDEPDKVDVFVNGQLMSSGSSNDYILAAATGSVSFYFDLFSGDIVSIRTY